MNINHKQKTFDKPLKKSAKSLITVLLSILAIVVGIQFGNLLYKLDLHFIDDIDTDNFKNIIDLSIPIVESVYNSGKSSASFSGEVKELFTRIFDFDLDSPASILNAQSPIFMSYYRAQSLKKMSMDDKAQSGQTTGSEAGNSSTPLGSGDSSNGSNGSNGGSNGNSGNNGNSNNNVNNGNSLTNGDPPGGKADPGSNNSNLTGNGDTAGASPGNGRADAGNSGSGTGNKTGEPGDSNIDTGKSTENGGNAGTGKTAGSGSDGSGNGSSGDKLLAGQLDGTPESSMSIGTEYGFSKYADITGQMNNGTDGQNQDNQQHLGNSGGNKQFTQGVQPISSVTYEIEDEKEGDERETVELDKIQIKNYTKHKINIAKLLKEPLNINFSKKGPKVLIYHTHTSESYVLKEADLGKKNVPSFNSNPKYSVVRVGEELARYLEKYGIDTLHNGTVHDKVRDAAYGVSINTLQSYKKSYPSLQVYIDVHRDAVESDKPKLRITKEINGKNCAQIMFVVGAEGMLPHPDWQENLKFVLKLQQKLNEKYPGLARPVLIVGKRYNQQISNNAILIEVGGDGNLLSECIESTKYLAEALNDVMTDK